MSTLLPQTGLFVFKPRQENSFFCFSWCAPLWHFLTVFHPATWSRRPAYLVVFVVWVLQAECLRRWQECFAAWWTTLSGFPLAVWGLLCAPSGSVVDVESSSVPVCLSGSWSLHSFGLCGVWGAVWLWLLGVPLLEGLLVAFYSTAPVAWTLGHIIVYFSLWTMHFLIPWLSVMFDTYTVLFLVFFVAFMFWFVKRFELWKSAI